MLGAEFRHRVTHLGLTDVLYVIGKTLISYLVMTSTNVPGLKRSLWPAPFSQVVSAADRSLSIYLLHVSFGLSVFVTKFVFDECIIRRN